MIVVPHMAALDLTLIGRSDATLSLEWEVSQVGGDLEERPFLAAFAQGIPEIGDSHPTRPGLVATEKRVRHVSANDDGEIFRVTVIYKLPSFSGRGDEEPDRDPGVIEVGAVVGQDTRFRDILGEVISVGYEATVQLDTTTETEFKTQVIEVEYDVAETVLARTRVESRPPSDLAPTYVGSVNSRAIWGYGERSLKCTRIQGISNDGGITYEVSYEFQYRPQTWDAFVYYTDEQSGRPPDDLVPGVGSKRVRVYVERDFSQLPVSF